MDNHHDQRERDPMEVAHSLCNWASYEGYLYEAHPASIRYEEASLQDVFDRNTPEELESLATRIRDARIVGLCVDRQNKLVTVLTKGKIKARVRNPLPSVAGDVHIDYIENAAPQDLPGTLPQQALNPTPCFLHNNRISCGSSVHIANRFGAGTLGCLVRSENGSLCGLSNNHVCGDCNHAEQGMHIISPAPFDARANGPAPTTIGQHWKLTPLLSGNPRALRLQRHDAAVFGVTQPDVLTSMQGAGFYDTPAETMAPLAGMKVEKTGRTTGRTYGTIRGENILPLPVKFSSPDFSSVVYFEHSYAVIGERGEPFSEPGDSGSLVVTDSQSKAVGLVFAGSGGVSHILPIQPTLDELDVTLVSGHNV